MHERRSVTSWALRSMADVVVDASAMVDALAGTALGPAATVRLRNQTLHAPAHFDAEALSPLVRPQRAGPLSVRQEEVGNLLLASLPPEEFRELAPRLTRVGLEPGDDVLIDVANVSGAVRLVSA